MRTNNRGLRIVFDIDDTISRVHTKGDYANAEEIWEVTDQIRSLKKQGHTIILHTARGMVSCGGDVEAARRKNEETLKAWLQEHAVPYDEIWWGKPYADLYVDDKGISLDDFKAGAMEQMQGFSGAEVVRIGRMVIKTAENAEKQARWYKETEERMYVRKWRFNVPEVLSCNFGRLTMTLVEGKKATEIDRREMWRVTRAVIDKVLKAFKRERLEGENDVDWYKAYVGSRAEEIGIDREKVEQDIERTRDLLKVRTYCHGDLSMSNIIVDGEQITLIDPSQKEVSSWLLDVSKYWASAKGLDAIIGGSDKWKPDSHTGVMLINWLSPDECEAALLLERGHWIRVARYAKVLGRQDVFEKLMEKIREWYG